MRRTLKGYWVALLITASSASAGAFVWPNAVERVEKQLEHADAGVRRRATQRLTELPPAIARRLTLKALSDSDLEVRMAAAEAARSLRLAEAGDAVVAWLNDPEPRLRLSAAELLTTSPSANAIAALGRVLGDADANVRIAAAQALGASGQKQAGLALLGHLDDAEPNVRRAVIAALARLRDTRAVVPLLGKIQDQRPIVRRSVAEALGVLGDTRATSALVLALRDPDELVRIGALEALGALGDKSATLSVVALLEQEERPSVRAAALSTLSSLPATESLEALMRALAADDPQNPDSPVRAALARAGQRAVPRLQQCLAGQPAPLLGDGCALSLARIGGKQAASAIAEARRRGVVRARAALVALAELGDESYLPLVLEHLEDKDPFVRRAALDAAALLLDPSKPDGRAVEPIARALENGRASKAERGALVALLGRTGSPRAARLILPLADNSDDAVLRAGALEALGLLGPAGQDKVLILALDAKEPAVRLAAAVALRRSAAGASARVLLDRLDRKAEQDRAAIAIALAGALSRSADSADLDRTERMLIASQGGERDALIEAFGRAPKAGPRLAALVRRLPSVADRAKIAEALGSHPAQASALRELGRDADGSVRANAVWSLGGSGGAGDVALLTQALSDRDVAVAGNAGAALGRLAARGASTLGPVLCRTLGAQRAAVRAGALGGLRVAKLRCAGGEERELVRSDRSETVRRAAAELIARVPSSDAAADRRALERCASEDPSGAVAGACSRPPQPALGGSEPVSVYVVPSGESSPAERVPFALLRADGLVRFGLSDRRGEVFEHDAPRGFVALDVPAPLAE